MNLPPCTFIDKQTANNCCRIIIKFDLHNFYFGVMKNDQLLFMTHELALDAAVRRGISQLASACALPTAASWNLLD